MAVAKKTTYNEVLKEALNQPAIKDCKLSRAEIEARIAEIGKQLIGYMPNEERLCAVADRSELRATLRAMDIEAHERAELMRLKEKYESK